MAEKVEIILEADDNASGKIENVEESLQSLSSTAMKENLLDLKNAAIGAFGAISTAAGEIIDIAAEDEIVMMRMDAQLRALGETAAVSADDIQTFADEISKISGFDDEALIEGQTALLRFGNLSREQFKDATDAAADLAAMTGMSLPAAFEAVGRALDNPEQGLGRLSRKIGDLTDEQQAAIDEMMKLGDTAGAQALILEALSGKVDGAAKAYGETFAGAVDKANVKIDNTLSKLGQLVTSNAPEWLITLAVGAQRAGGMLGPVVDGVADLGLAALALSKQGGIAALSASIKTGLNSVLTGLTAKLGTVAGALGTTSAALGGLGLAIGALIIVWQIFGDQAKANAIRIGTILEALFAEIDNKITTFGANLKVKAKETFGGVGAAIVDGITTGVRMAWGALTGDLGGLLIELYTDAMRTLNAHSPSKLWSKNVGETAIAGGINEGMEIGMKKSPIGNMLTPGNFGGRGGGAPTIILQYSPAISTASRAEAEAQILPVINSALRHYRK